LADVTAVIGQQDDELRDMYRSSNFDLISHLPSLDYCYREDIEPSRFLRRFNQLHLSIPRAMKNHQLAFGIAKDKYVPVAEVSFFDGFL
jgi:hypothetical protein